MQHGLQAWWPVFVPFILYAVFVRILYGLDTNPEYLLGTFLIRVIILTSVFLVTFTMLRMAAYLLYERPKSPLRQFLLDIWSLLSNPARLAMAAVLFVPLYMFFPAFATFKSNIAFTNPFDWDQTFMQLDAWLHGGWHPWQWLYPLLKSEYATLLLNAAYNFWYFPLFGMLLFSSLQRRMDERVVHYLFAFFFTWVIGGSLLAWYFSSAGPAFYDRIVQGADPYAPLMAHLKALNEIVPVWALEKQEFLWWAYQNRFNDTGGISAFPSMHNAQAVLLALLAWRYGRRLGWATTVFAFLVFLSSIWLGWHYAVDAYAGALIAVVSWWLAAPLTRFTMKRPVVRQLNALLCQLDREENRERDLLTLEVHARDRGMA